MKIYEAEKIDKLESALRCSSIAMFCPITHRDLPNEISDQIKLSMASITDRPNQSDLYYLHSILVSAGWNKNDDVFDVADLWAARDTPVDKPFNYMHDDSDIIGHMISSAVMSEDGLVISDEACLPDKVDIVTSAVIYKTWSDPDQSGRVRDLIDQIEQGQLAVSMECVFHNFDYAIVSPSGERLVRARDENSAFLTKHLRAYGGSGEYEGFKIGRLLRAFTFSGKGLVDKPANPRSIILSKDVDPFKPVTDTFTTLAMEVIMPEDNSALVSELESSLASAKADVTTLASEIDMHKSTIGTLEAQISELENTIATVTQEKLTLSQQIQSMVAEAKLSGRKTALLTAGADEARATELLTKFAEASDEMFDAVVALIVKPTEVEAEVEVEAEAETEVEANVEDLETVEEVDLPVDTPSVDETVANNISIASQWLRSNVLKSTKNLK